MNSKSSTQVEDKKAPEVTKLHTTPMERRSSSNSCLDLLSRTAMLKDKENNQSTLKTAASTGTNGQKVSQQEEDKARQEGQRSTSTSDDPAAQQSSTSLALTPAPKMKLEEKLSRPPSSASTAQTTSPPDHPETSKSTTAEDNEDTSEGMGIPAPPPSTGTIAGSTVAASAPPSQSSSHGFSIPHSTGHRHHRHPDPSSEDSAYHHHHHHHPTSYPTHHSGGLAYAVSSRGGGHGHSHTPGYGGPRIPAEHTPHHQHHPSSYYGGGSSGGYSHPHSYHHPHHHSHQHHGGGSSVPPAFHPPPYGSSSARQPEPMGMHPHHHHHPSSSSYQPFRAPTPTGGYSSASNSYPYDPSPRSSHPPPPGYATLRGGATTHNIPTTTSTSSSQEPYHGAPAGTASTGAAPESTSTRVTPDQHIPRSVTREHMERSASSASMATSASGTSPNHHHGASSSAYETLLRENQILHGQVKDRDATIASLQQQVGYLQSQIHDLRQLPSGGKISHIPIDEMLRIMKEYGSEVSNQTLPTRKTEIKKTSVIRQFRRWNPDFFRYFQQDADGKWQPRLGKDGELKRRAEKRMSVKAEKREAALASAPSL